MSVWIVQTHATELDIRGAAYHHARRQARRQMHRRYRTVRERLRVTGASEALHIPHAAAEVPREHVEEDRAGDPNVAAAARARTGHVRVQRPIEIVIPCRNVTAVSADIVREPGGGPVILIVH